ncbi:MAG: tRNA epoxyqueuosine(34) reductase QueG [Deltaproteobacteria bacterium]|nr:tRNA epoxyqueuosine(34) reductase QueG [Deltaproteobacteria bacterium]
MATEGSADPADDPDMLVVRSKSARRRLDRAKALPTWGESEQQTRQRRTRLVKQLALESGFSRVGIARAEALPDHRATLQTWIDAGHHGQMAWMAKDVARRCDPGQVVAGAQAVVALALDYDTAQPHTGDLDGSGQDRLWVSRYAWGDDYHQVAAKRLRRLEGAVTRALQPELGERFRGPGGPERPFSAVRDFRWYVDHGPVLERVWAQRAGLGWQGRHSLLVDPRRGSYFFLAAVVTSIALDADEPMVDHCGSCRACVDACPTGAILPERLVDARRCIAHATIEVEGPVTAEIRALAGDHLFGCDVCQEACPYNRFSQPCGDPAFEPRPGLLAPTRAAVRAWAEPGGDAHLAGSPLRRRGVAALAELASNPGPASAT